MTTFREQRRLFDDPISELRIGIFSDSVVTVHEHACLSEVLDLLEQHRELLASHPQISAQRFSLYVRASFVLKRGCR